MLDDGVSRITESLKNLALKELITQWKCQTRKY